MAGTRTRIKSTDCSSEPKRSHSAWRSRFVVQQHTSTVPACERLTLESNYDGVLLNKSFSLYSRWESFPTSELSVSISVHPWPGVWGWAGLAKELAADEHGSKARIVPRNRNAPILPGDQVISCSRAHQTSTRGPGFRWCAFEQNFLKLRGGMELFRSRSDPCRYQRSSVVSSWGGEGW